MFPIKYIDNNLVWNKDNDKKVLSMYENVFFEMLAYSMQ